MRVEFDVWCEARNAVLQSAGAWTTNDERGSAILGAMRWRPLTPWCRSNVNSYLLFLHQRKFHFPSIPCHQYIASCLSRSDSLSVRYCSGKLSGLSCHTNEFDDCRVGDRAVAVTAGFLGFPIPYPWLVSRGQKPQMRYSNRSGLAQPADSLSGINPPWPGVADE